MRRLALLTATIALLALPASGLALSWGQKPTGWQTPQTYLTMARGKHTLIVKALHEGGGFTAKSAKLTSCYRVNRRVIGCNVWVYNVYDPYTDVNGDHHFDWESAYEAATLHKDGRVTVGLNYYR